MLNFPKDRSIHRPLHLYLPEPAYYFISSRTYGGLAYFRDELKKEILLKVIFEKIREFEFSLSGWVVLNNHYHLLLKAENGIDLAKLISQVNGKSSYLLNKIENRKGRKIWYQYWDKIVSDEKSFYCHLNYIHQNPIKHNLIKNLDELVGYQFCSYKDYLKKFGQDWLDDCFANYPIIDYIKE
ncbi:MAG: transposase [Patescibacteria group bacterium]